MLDFFNKKENKTNSNNESNKSLLGLISNKFKNTKSLFHKKFNKIFYKKEIQVNILEELEKMLITSDVSINTTEKILSYIKDKSFNKNINNIDDLFFELEKYIIILLNKKIANFDFKEKENTFVLLVCGINGVGKTSLIGKISHFLKKNNL